MNPRVLPVDRLLAGYNLLLAGVWGLYLGRTPHAGWIAAAHLAGATLPLWWRRAPTPLSQPLRAIRDLYPLILLSALYTELGLLHALRTGPSFDPAVRALELFVFGQHLAATWMPATHSLFLSEVLHAAYWGYYLLIVVPPLVLACTGRGAAARDLIFRITLVYLTCYLVFIVAPVYGPREWVTRYSGPLTDGFFYRLVNTTVDFGAAPGCAFPSSHVAAAVTVGVTGWRWFSRPVAAFLALDALGVTLGTVFTQNHFAIDAVAGVVWGAVFALLVAPPMARWLEDRPALEPSALRG